MIAALGVSTAALAIDGVYHVEGHGPGSSDTYKGEAQIKKTGDTYSIVWRVGQTRHLGTGIRTDNVLSVFFQPLERGAGAGLASFRVVDDKITEGTWTVLGSKSVGIERWTPDRGD
jgi:hypothetical protein